jgi:hypothetical protein
MHDDAPEALERYRLLASAIAGRVVDVAAAAPGESAWTDGNIVFVAVDAPARDRVGSIAVQAALLAAGSIDRDLLAPLARRSAVIPRYLAIEGHRALAAQIDVLPSAARALIDERAAARVDSPAASLELARSGTVVAAAPECFGTIRPKHVRAPETGVAPAAEAAGNVPRRSAQEGLRELDDDADDVDDPSVPDVFSSPVGGGGAIGRLLGSMFTHKRSNAAGPLGADAPTRTTTKSSRRGTTGVVLSLHASPAGAAAATESAGATYPEWDLHRNRYRPDWCTVVETPPAADELEPFTPPGGHALRRALARLGVGLDRRHRQIQGDDIDVDAAVESRVESLAGTAPDESVYIDSLRRRRDLAVLIMLDISGSAGEPSPTGTTVHEQQRHTAAALAVALHDLGDRVALYAFRSQGRAAVTVVPVKRFADALDSRACRRLGGLKPGAYTRVGAAIRHAAAVIERDGGTPRRLLVVVSDGFAYDHGYEGAYGEADARRALAEARRRGTGCLCLSVGAGTDAAALRRVFGTAAYATIPRVEQLPSIVAPLFHFALRSSETQRRVSQRRTRTRERLFVDGRTR